MITVLFFLSSGLFLGWSLGANDAANVWGTAVGTRMVSFRRAALLCSIFVILGAVISGSGASDTIGKLGAINAIGGAFTVALAAGISVYVMTRWGLPVSTSQAIIGAIVGWNFYTRSTVNWNALLKILGSWFFSPLLTAFFAFVLYFIVRGILRRSRMHLFREDRYIRWLLLSVGAFGSFSLGANNIANVMGVFISSVPFEPLELGWLRISVVQQLFFIGGIAIAVGVFTYSRRVMSTVGSQLYHLSPVTAFIVVLSSSLVLFLFASEALHTFLSVRNLPAFPLVPVSSSQSIIGGILGIALARRGRNIHYRLLLRIGSGWVATPAMAAAVAYVLLFIMSNVFALPVY